MRLTFGPMMRTPFDYLRLDHAQTSESHMWATENGRIPTIISSFGRVPQMFRFLGAMIRIEHVPSYAALTIHLVLPLWMIAFASGIPAFILARGITWRRRGPDECRTCGYSRVGLPIGEACPECGDGGGGKVKANTEDAEVRTEVAERIR
ncbi:MAG: hypothetical protein AB7V21_01195 [Phycisphaerales bacterium]